jgi:3'(2'), 5'-bisphosphate nucleotidase
MFEKERDVALAAARLGADAVMAVRRAGFSVQFKDAAHDDPVTAADRASNDVIVRTLREAFPDDTIVAEEDALPAGFEKAHRCWFVDPLDGTKEFVAGITEFCVMIGLAIDGVATVGAVAVPAEEYALVGALGHPSVRIDAHGTRALTLSSSSDAAHARIVTSRMRRHARLDGIYKQLGSPREVRCGSVGVKVAKLLLDEADAYIHPGPGTKLWDLCAPEAIVRAAGGMFTDEHGHAINYARPNVAHNDGMVVSGREMHGALLDAVARAGLPSGERV